MVQCMKNTHPGHVAACVAILQGMCVAKTEDEDQKQVSYEASRVVCDVGGIRALLRAVQHDLPEAILCQAVETLGVLCDSADSSDDMRADTLDVVTALAAQIPSPDDWQDWHCALLHARAENAANARVLRRLFLPYDHVGSDQHGGVGDESSVARSADKVNPLSGQGWITELGAEQLAESVRAAHVQRAEVEGEGLVHERGVHLRGTTTRPCAFSFLPGDQLPPQRRFHDANSHANTAGRCNGPREELGRVAAA